MDKSKGDSVFASLSLFIPFLLTLGLMALFQIPSPEQFVSKLTPIFSFLFLYYWTIHRSNAAPTIAVFFLALIQDLWGETIIGLTPILAILAHIGLLPLQEIFRVAPFALRWLAFAILIVIFTIVKWALLSLILLHPVAVIDLGFQAVVTIAFYPFINLLYAKIDREIIMY